MKITGLLAAFAVLSLIIAPAISQPSLRGCACEPRDCQGKSAENCCAKSQESCISPGCACADLVSSYSGMDYFDPAYFHSNSGKSASRSSPGKDSRGQVGSGNAPPPFSPLSAAATDYVGPPDPDVVEFLPPSAKYVFQVLASDGPLTQKDIISRTDLPARTVRYALDRLRGEEMLEERFCFRDARQSLYRLHGMDTR